MTEHLSSDPRAQGRRRLLKILAATGGAFASSTVLPSRWTRPVIDSLMIPLHAQASPLPLVVGPFTAVSNQAGSLFDLLVAPVHAATSRAVLVGNASVDLAWNLNTSGYSICVEADVDTPNGIVNVLLSGGGGRVGNQLDPYSGALPGGSLQIVNQMAGVTELSFNAQFQAASTNGTASPAGTGCFLNTTLSLQMSSPYPEGERS